MAFKKVKGFENYYINEEGVIKNAKGKVMKVRLNRYGYPRINLQKDRIKHTAYVHHLVLATFKPEVDPTGLTVDHIDGNKENNSLSNLRYMAEGENLHLAHLRNNKEILFCISELRRDYTEKEIISYLKAMPQATQRGAEKA